MCDFCSVVIVLRPEKPFHKTRFLGRAAHKLFFLMLAAAGESALAAELHNRDAAQPFTVSDLFQSDEAGAHYWLRVTGLEPRVCAALRALVASLPGQATVDGWAVVFAADDQHEWAGQASAADFISAHWPPPPGDRLMLEFATPTALKSVGLYRPFPDPPLVFRLLYERLERVPELALPFQPDRESVEAFASYFLAIEDYRITCQIVPLKGPIPAFTGAITYAVQPDNTVFRKRAITRRDRDGDARLLALYDDLRARHADYARLLHLLGAFAFYSGLGVKTGQGLGVVRVV